MFSFYRAKVATQRTFGKMVSTKALVNVTFATCVVGINIIVDGIEFVLVDYFSGGPSEGGAAFLMLLWTTNIILTCWWCSEYCNVKPLEDDLTDDKNSIENIIKRGQDRFKYLDKTKGTK
jgi:hypothetical protein